MITPQTCPICDKELPPNSATELKSFPFCTKRCQQIDFTRWSDGRYAIVEDLMQALQRNPDLEIPEEEF